MISEIRRAINAFRKDEPLPIYMQMQADLFDLCDKYERRGVDATEAIFSLFVVARKIISHNKKDDKTCKEILNYLFDVVEDMYSKQYGDEK